MSVVVIMLVAIFAFGIFFIQSKNYEESIKSQVDSLGGTIVSIERGKYKIC